MSGSLPALQEHAQAAADAFCRRYVQPRSRKGRQSTRQSHTRDASPHDPLPKTLMKGIPRNFEVFEPIDFLAEPVQHIPDKEAHQIN